MMLEVAVSTTAELLAKAAPKAAADGAHMTAGNVADAAGIAAAAVAADAVTADAADVAAAAAGIANQQNVVSLNLHCCWH